MYRSGYEWTRADLAKLRKLAAQGVSSTDAANELGRTVGGTKYKAMVEGIPFSSINQPKGVQKRRFRKARK